MELEDDLRESGIILWLAALNPAAFEVVEHSPLGETMGHKRMFFDLPHAVEHYEKTQGDGNG